MYVRMYVSIALSLCLSIYIYMAELEDGDAQ